MSFVAAPSRVKVWDMPHGAVLSLSPRRERVGVRGNERSWMEKLMVWKAREAKEVKNGAGERFATRNRINRL